MAEAAEKKGGKRTLAIVLIVIAAVIVVAVVGAGIMFKDELGIIGSIEKLSAGENVYSMEINGYHDDEIFAHGLSSDAELTSILAQKISKGFYSPEKTGVDNVACSIYSGVDAAGEHLWGRNFDWTETASIIVRSAPENAYSSISTVALSNITDIENLDGMAGKMMSIAAYYVPMDGINEKGLCVADLEVNEGGMGDPDTEKPDLTITTAIRLMLNKAADVDEAVALLEQYDIHPSGSISHHLAISDAAGKAVVVEFLGTEMVVTPTNCITNFCIANGDTAAGGESAETRYNALKAVEEQSAGVIDAAGVLDAMKTVTQTQGKWATKWTIIYSDAKKSMDIYFDGDFSSPLSFSLENAG